MHILGLTIEAGASLHISNVMPVFIWHSRFAQVVHPGDAGLNGPHQRWVSGKIYGVGAGLAQGGLSSVLHRTNSRIGHVVEHADIIDQLRDPQLSGSLVCRLG